MILSKNAIKRIGRVWECGDIYSSRAEGARDAVRYAHRELRLGRLPEFHPDDEDFFGVRFSDSTNGRRFLDGYDDVIRAVVERVFR